MKLVKIDPKKDYLLIPDAVWDGLADKIQENLAIYVSGGRIGQLVSLSMLNAATFTRAERIRLQGITLIPGLIDCHVHLAMNSSDLRQAVEEWEQRPEMTAQRIRGEALNYLAAGVVAVRDGGDMANIGLQARNMVREGICPGPIIISTGRAIFRKGKYGSFLGPGIENAAEAATQIAELKNEGVDQLKVVNSGIVSFKQFGTVGPPQFTREELTFMVNQAHALGLKVMAHASSREAVDTAIQAGVDSVEHGYFLESSQLELMAKFNTAWVPTLAPLGNLVKNGKPPYEGADLDVIRRSLEIQLSRVKEAHDVGVRLGIGTDAGANNVPHGLSYHDELSFFAAAGLSCTAILRLATARSAAILGLEQKIGSIRSGKEPFLLGIRGNPHKSLTFIRHPEWVFMPAPHF